MPEIKNPSVAKLKEWIEESDNIVFFGGAGVSTESGIPDFRSENGIYNTVHKYKVRPEEILSHSFFMRDPETFYDFYRSTLVADGVKPNAAHLALAKLEKIGKLKALITQNIDGLHQAAGSNNIYELHGTMARNYCMRCGAEYDMEFMVKAEGVPHCTKCGGIIKPDVVLYEEPLDGEVIEGAVEAIVNADVLIIGGTSLNVYPAAGFISYYEGRKMVLINRDATPYDDRCDLLIRDSIGKVLSLVTEDL